MDQFRVVKTTHNGLLLLTSDHGKAAEKKLVLYMGGKPCAVVQDTIASVHDPLYLAEPLHGIAIKPGTVLRSRR